MLARGLGARLELLLLPPVLVDSHSLALVHTFSRIPWGTMGRQGGVKNGSLIVFKIESYKEEGHPPAGCPSCIRGIGCGAWIRTKDLRVMSPTSCRCSTPRFQLYPGLFRAPSQGIPHLLRKAGLWIASEKTRLHKRGRILARRRLSKETCAGKDAPERPSATVTGPGSE